MYSYYVDFESKRLENWEKIIQPFSYNPEVKDLSLRVILALALMLKFLSFSDSLL